MEALPYYKWHWQDWRANRRVQRMPWQAKGPYRELLDELWVEGSLPIDMENLADVVGCTAEELRALWVHIGPCFQERDGRLYNEKMDRQRTASDSIRVANANAGRAGGIAKLANASERLADDEQLPSERHIEEKRRLEESREEKKPSRGKRERKQSHPLYEHVKDLVFRYYSNRNGVEPEWDGAEGKALALLLAANPEAPREHWNACMVGRSGSDVNHADRPSKWLRSLSSYRNAVNTYNRPKGQPAEPRKIVYSKPEDDDA